MPNRVLLFAATLALISFLLAAPVRGNCFDCCAYGTCPSGWTCCGCPSECYCCSDNSLCRSSGSGYSCSFRLQKFPWITSEDKEKSNAVSTGVLTAEEVERVRVAGWKAGTNETETAGKVDGRLRGALREEQMEEENKAELA